MAPKIVYFADLTHTAQGISAAPLLRNFNLVPLEDADACCGSAGIYSLLQPDLSRKILERKIQAIRKSGAEVVVTGNPGCILQIRSAGLPVRVAHPVELLAETLQK